MRTHFAMQGECISSIAARFGLTEEELCRAPGNAKLLRLRRSRNILQPGDEVHLPEPGKREEICATGRTHLFEVRTPRVELRVALVDHTGRALAGRKYRVSGEGVNKISKTDGEGLVVVSIPATLEKVLLEGWLYEEDEGAAPDTVYELEVGHLDPYDTVTGMQARLQNLGYGCPVSGTLCEATRAAIRYFLGLGEDGDESEGTVGEALAGRHEGSAP